jgi:hypothetical protein
MDAAGDPVTSPRLQRWWRNARRFLEWLSAGEELPQRADGPIGPPLRSIVGVAGWLSAAERLPVSESAPAETARLAGSPVRWLLSPEALPEAPPEDSTDRDSTGSLARRLLAPERLPISETDTAGSGPSVVKWLLAPEPLPPPRNDAPASRSQEE